MKKKRFTLQEAFAQQRDDGEFSYDLTPNIQGGQRTLSHTLHQRTAIDGGRLHQNRADDTPHLGRKGGEY